MSKKGKISAATLGGLLALTLVVTCVTVYQSGSKSTPNEKEFVKENQEDSVDQAIKTEERDEEETEDVNTSDVEGTKTVEEEQDTATEDSAEQEAFARGYRQGRVSRRSTGRNRRRGAGSPGRGSAGTESGRCGSSAGY